MILRLVRLLGLVAVTVSCGGLFAVGYAQALPAQELLNPDGTLNLETGISGCVDVSGYQVRLDAERGPVFVPLAGATTDIRQEGTSALSGSQPQRGPLAPMAAGEAWSPLGTGVDGPVFTIVISNGTVYAGGIFTTAGGEDANYIAKWGVVAFTKGDVNGDGSIDVIDVRLCLQIAQGYIAGTPQQRAAADVDGDGNVDETDAQILSEYIIGMRTTLP